MTSWADKEIEQLANGIIVSFRPTGRSMEPKIFSGNLCTVEPIESAQIEVGDIVLCKVSNSVYLHNVLEIKDDDFLIGNNKGKINGWTKIIYGKLLKVEK